MTTIVTETADAAFPISNCTGGSRADTFRLATATANDLYIQYDNISSNGLAIGRANLLQANFVNRLIIRNSAYSYTIPSAISGLKVWADATRGVTQGASNVVN